ncbi:MAG: relaxase domain-containing protein [Planctomycetaceae bacterium]|nr:relaxase domain-containing protein [Planctomycetaceae bacterium]
MTAKCQVLGIGFDGSYYESSVNLNYWEEGGTAPGQWFGSGARELGLQGIVRSQTLASVLAGRHPGSAKPLLRSMNSESAKNHGRLESVDGTHISHRPGFDLQFAVPKSVSAFWAVAPPDVKHTVQDCVDRAVRASLSSLESRVPLARRIEGGTVLREKAKLVVSMYDHVTSRTGDPHLHRHCVIANVCRRDDGEWRTIDSRSLHQWTRTIGPLFRANLAHELRSRLGLSLEPGRDQTGKCREWFEIEGIPKALLGDWSTRRESILNLLSSTQRRIAKAREFAALKTRPDKAELVPRKELFDGWQKQAAGHGLNADVARSLCNAPQQQAQVRGELFQSAWKSALNDLTLSKAWFTERALIQAVAERLQTGFYSGQDIERRIQERMNLSSELIPLRSVNGDRNFTTRDMWTLEQQFLKSTEVLRSRPGAQVSKRNVEQTLSRNPQLDDEQRSAVRTLLTQDSAIRVLTGVAGSGKSTTIGAVRDGFEQQGFRVFGGALSGIAKEELVAKTGIKARTVASYLYHLDRSTGQKVWDRLSHDVRQLTRAAFGLSTSRYQKVGLDAKSVLILDEAGMLGTRSLQRILLLAEKAGATVILTGDTRQLQPIEAGGPLRRLVSELSTAHLSVNRRQQDPKDQEAVQQLRDGKVEEAIRNYAERGRIKLSSDRHGAILDLVRTWEQQGGYRTPSKHAILTQTRAEAATVNRECQTVRLQKSLIPPVLRLTHEGVSYYRGDRVLFHRAARGHGIENGHKGTVLSVNPVLRTLKVRLDRPVQGDSSRSARDAIVTVSVKEFRNSGISLGYAFTTHKGQGTTVEHAYVLAGGFQTDREMLYVQATRARWSTHFFLSRDDAGPNLTAFVDSVRQSRASQLAHDLGERHTRQSPQPER